MKELMLNCELGETFFNFFFFLLVFDCDLLKGRPSKLPLM